MLNLGQEAQAALEQRECLDNICEVADVQHESIPSMDHSIYLTPTGQQNQQNQLFCYTWPCGLSRDNDTFYFFLTTRDTFGPSYDLCTSIIYVETWESLAYNKLWAEFHNEWMCQMPALDVALSFQSLAEFCTTKSVFWFLVAIPSSFHRPTHNPATTMYLMYYLNEKGDRVYTLKVRSCLMHLFEWSKDLDWQHADWICLSRRSIPRACPPSLLTQHVSHLTTSSLVNVSLSRSVSRSCLLRCLLVPCKTTFSYLFSALSRFSCFLEDNNSKKVLASVRYIFLFDILAVFWSPLIYTQTAHTHTYYGLKVHFINSISMGCKEWMVDDGWWITLASCSILHALS